MRCFMSAGDSDWVETAAAGTASGGEDGAGGNLMLKLESSDAVLLILLLVVIFYVLPKWALRKVAAWRAPALGTKRD